MVGKPSPEALKQTANALGDSSRFAIFWHIYESPKPVTVAELTSLMGFNHNAIRQHLVQLVQSNLVLEEDETRTRPGRPRKLYRAREDALSGFGDASRSYQRIAHLLVELARSGDDPYQVGLRAGEQKLVGVETLDRVSELVRSLAAEGFEPTLKEVKKRPQVVLGQCPFADVASGGESVVCEIHRGLIDGILGRPAALSIRDPHRGGCRVLL